MRPRSGLWKAFAGLALLGVVCVLSWRWWMAQQTPQMPLPSAISLPPTDATPLPSPELAQAYRRLTIPYLREQRYTSQLAPLQDIAQNSEFRTYLTSYQSEGLRINSLLTIPEGEQPANGWPAVVFIHGYIPPSQYQTTERYQDYVNYLARQGLVVLKIDLRGHGDSEGEPSGAYYSGDYVTDTLHAYAALQSADFVDPERIGLWGHSMAGNVVLRTVTAKPDIPAAVIWAGAVYTYEDFQDYRIQDQSYRPPADDAPRRQFRQNLFDQVGDFNPQDPFWRQVVPTNYLGDVQTAIQIHHARNDTVVDIRYSQNLNEILQQVGLENELYEYATGGHNLSSPAFGQAMQRTATFLVEQMP